MRALLLAILVGAMGWSAYWWVGAGRVEQASFAWMQANQVTYSKLAVRGFPNRFDTTIDTPRWGDWAAPFLQLFRVSYDANHIITVLPNSVDTPFGQIQAQEARASLILDPGTGHLRRMDLEAYGVTLPSGATVETVQISTRPSARQNGGTDLFIGLAGVASDGTRRDIRLDLVVILNGPIGLHVPRPRATQIHVEQADISGIGSFTGILTLDAQGQAAGTLRADEGATLILGNGRIRRGDQDLGAAPPLSISDI